MSPTGTNNHPPKGPQPVPGHRFEARTALYISDIFRSIVRETHPNDAYNAGTDLIKVAPATIAVCKWALLPENTLFTMPPHIPRMPLLSILIIRKLIMVVENKMQWCNGGSLAMISRVSLSLRQCVFTIGFTRDESCMDLDCRRESSRKPDCETEFTYNLLRTLQP
ncbi:hypothetical protein J6590_069404 [Homalodisca vitripennis]|nr:hypothetical protein J6590_069404 [Homalodisca vitripennis]